MKRVKFQTTDDRYTGLSYETTLEKLEVLPRAGELIKMPYFGPSKVNDIAYDISGGVILIILDRYERETQK